MHKLKTGIGNH